MSIVARWFAPAEHRFANFAEPKNKHAAWCNIWTHPTAPCNCGMSG